MSAATANQSQGAVPAGPGPLDLRTILHKQVSLVATIAVRPLPLGELLRHGGALLRLDKGAGEPLELQVNGRTIASGEAVRVGDRCGLRVTRIDPLRDVIRALGSGAPAT